MKKLLFLCCLLPIISSAQSFDSTGLRLAYTHSNQSHNLGFAGISLNSYDSGNAGFMSIPTGTTIYGGVHLGAHSDMPSKVQIIPEVGIEAALVILTAGISVNTHCFQPRIGLSLVNVHGCYLGYSVPFREKTSFEGFTLTIFLNIFDNF